MPKDLTVQDLKELMIFDLERRGKSPDFIAGYLAAQEKSGWLRNECPAWIRNSAGLYYAIPISEPEPRTTPRK